MIFINNHKSTSKPTHYLPYCYRHINQKQNIKNNKVFHSKPLTRNFDRANIRLLRLQFRHNHSQPPMLHARFTSSTLTFSSNLNLLKNLPLPISIWYNVFPFSSCSLIFSPLMCKNNPLPLILFHFHLHFLLLQLKDISLEDVGSQYFLLINEDGKI